MLQSECVEWQGWPLLVGSIQVSDSVSSKIGFKAVSACMASPQPQVTSNQLIGEGGQTRLAQVLVAGQLKSRRRSVRLLIRHCINIRPHPPNTRHIFPTGSHSQPPTTHYPPPSVTRSLSAQPVAQLMTGRPGPFPSTDSDLFTPANVWAPITRTPLTLRSIAIVIMTSDDRIKSGKSLPAVRRYQLYVSPADRRDLPPHTPSLPGILVRIRGGGCKHSASSSSHADIQTFTRPASRHPTYHQVSTSRPATVSTWLTRFPRHVVFADSDHPEIGVLACCDG